MAVICPICGAENPDSAEYCNLCLGAMGFLGSDNLAPVPVDNSVYQDKYPSSFSPDSSSPADKLTEELPEVTPADIGEYGKTTGYDFDLSVLSGSKPDSSSSPPKSALRKKVS